MIVISMITEPEDCDPVDQGPQGLARSEADFEAWVKDEWPHAKLVGELTWQIFDRDGNSLDTFLVGRQMDVYQPDNERIECAAVNYPDIGVMSVPRPGRHHTIMWLRLLLDGQRTPGNAEQGFLTDSGRFVGREEAFEIATRQNQIKVKHGSPGLLFSEDVWDTPPEARGYRIINDEDPD